MHSSRNPSQPIDRGQQRQLGEGQRQQRQLQQDGRSKAKGKATVASYNTGPQPKSGVSKAMGGLQARFPRLSSSSGPAHGHTPTVSSDQPDGRSMPVHPSVARVLERTEERALPLQKRRDFQSLDRSLKSFLRASNLPGLEYRLKLAGYQRLDDLLDTDAETLVSDGFTRLMAKRLMTALDNYIQRHLDVTGGQPSPFQLVRRGHLGQKIKSDPSEEMKALPNYGKRNVKRQSSSEPVLLRSGKKRTAPKQKHTSVVRLMSEDQMPSEPIFPNVIDVRDSVFVEEEGEGERESSQGSGSTSERSSMTSSSANITSSSSSGLVEIGRVVEIHSSRGGEDDAPPIIPVVNTTRSSAMFEEFFLDDIDTAAGPSAPSQSAAATPSDSEPSGQRQETENREELPQTRQTSLPHHRDSVGYELRPSASVPAGLWLSGPLESASPQYPEHTYIRVRAYSCPPSIASMATTTSLEAVLLVLTSAQDVDSIVSALKQLISQMRAQREGGSDVVTRDGVEGDGVRLVEAGVVAALMDVLQETVSSQRVVELCFKIIRLLTREGIMSRGTPLPAGTAATVLEAMNYHPASERVQVEGCWALGNIARTDPSQCDDIVNNGGLQTVSMAMESFPSSTKLQVVAMAAMGVVLGVVKEARLLLISEYGHVLDVVFQSMHFCPSEAQIQQYACSLLALLIAEVGAEIESGVMQLIVEHTAFATTTQSHDNHVTLWAAKVFANASDNAIFSGDPKLAGHTSDLLLEALSRFHDDSNIVTWCSYALLQLGSSAGCGGVVNDVIRGHQEQLLSICQSPPAGLTDKAKGYLKQLEGKLC